MLNDPKDSTQPRGVVAPLPFDSATQDWMLGGFMVALYDPENLPAIILATQPAREVQTPDGPAMIPGGILYAPDAN